QNSTNDEVTYILNNSEAQVLFIEGKGQIKSWKAIASSCPKIKAVICFEKKKEESAVIDWNDFLALGKEQLKSNSNCYVELCRQRKIDETATLIYTSGTTGRPKGVVITHLQIMSELKDTFPYLGVTTRDTSLTFLPYAHVLGRIEHWGHLYIGFTMAYAESIEKLKFNLRDVKPTIMIAVPRIFEKVYAGILAQVETNPMKKKIFRWALSIGKKVSAKKMKRESIPLSLLVAYKAAQKAVLGKISDAMGGQIRFVVSGGAPLSKEVAEFFHAADVLVLEGYGLTETTAAVCVNTPFDYKFGTVGKPLADVQVKLAEDGELLLKSDKVMKEYFQDPESTEKVLKDGWFATGDIAEILSSGHVKITDRKKDLIKTAGGKYVAPQRLENLLKTHAFISNVLIHGDQKKYIVALLTLDPVWLKNWQAENNVTGTPEEVVKNPKIIETVRKAVAEVNSQLANFETIKSFLVLPHDFTVEAGELTPSLKVKRKVLDQKFKKEIDSLYPGGSF
ncbi:MAG: long-chain fatty acid--CoA ligase, partial [Pseudobdellovibrionaceae bacterium]